MTNNSNNVDLTTIDLMGKIKADEPIEIIRAKVRAQYGFEFSGPFGYTREQEAAYARWWAWKHKKDPGKTIKDFLRSFDVYSRASAATMRAHELRVAAGMTTGPYFKPPKRTVGQTLNGPASYLGESYIYRDNDNARVFALDYINTEG